MQENDDTMQARLTQTEIEQALEAREFSRVRAAFSEMETADIADAIEELEPEDRAVVFRVLRREQAADVFEYLESDPQEALIRALGRGQVAAILNDMSPDDRTHLLEELSFAGSEHPDKCVVVDRLYVNERLADVVDDTDLSRYIL